ncbi:VOC family protein [Saccharothrix xinjiangensis]|uniref:VOC family protein n=1 Tax=Saccharothrix xinjiangensis TaxID=204798 RepID=A0ABV9XS95_9PSEU
MTSHIVAVAVDCPPAQVNALSGFWCAALGYRVHRTWQDSRGLTYTELSGAGPMLLLQPVEDPKTTKNRLHLDIAAERDQDAEVERLVGLGARRVGGDEGLPWVVLADPADNEFCVLPPR